MRSPANVIAYALNKLKNMVAFDGLEKESIFKSLRAYPTELHPLFEERITSHQLFPSGQSDLESTSSYTFYPTDLGFRGNRLMNYIFQSMFDCEEPEYDHVIYPKASNKTKDTHYFETLGMDRSLRDIIRGLSGNEQGSFVGMRQVIGFLTVSGVATDLFQDDFKQSSVCQGIMTFLLKHDKQFPATAHLELGGRAILKDLIMVSKFYASRGDNRAYCRDTNLSRHLAGICLHRLIYPKQSWIRKKLDRNNVIPQFDKDLLDLSVVQSRRDETTVLILGDISNFTGSCANAWAMLFCMVLELGKGGDRWSKKPNLFCIKGSFMTATWYDVLITYLYFNVGYPCFVEEFESYANLPGGFLGVAANITVGLLYLAVCLQNLLNMWASRARDVKAQAGGDDFAFLVTINVEYLSDFKRSVKEEMSRYVGHLKTFEVIELDSEPEGLLKGFEFCKKSMYLSRSDDRVHVRGENTIPLHSSMLPDCHLYKPEDQQDAWREYDLDLKKYETEYPEYQHITDSLRVAFVALYPTTYPPSRRKTVYTVKSEMEVTEVDGKLYTKEALRRIHSVPDITVGDQTFMSDFGSKHHHCLVMEYLTMRDVIYGETENVIILETKEIKKLEKATSVVKVGIKHDPFIVKQVINILT